MEAAKRLGAHDVFVGSDGDVFERIRASFPQGVDAVLDLVNDKIQIANNAKLLKPGSRIASTIFSADEDWFKQRAISAWNVSADHNPASTQEGLDELARLMVAGVLTARIGTRVILEEFARRQKDGVLETNEGKTVIDTQ